MVFLTGPVGRAAVVGLVVSSALLSAAVPTYRNQYGEECDENGVPIKHSDRHGGSYDSSPGAYFSDGTKNHDGNSYDSSPGAYFSDGTKNHDGDSYDTSPDAYFNDGTKDNYGDSYGDNKDYNPNPYGRSRDDYYNGQPVSYRPDEYNDNGSNGYDNYNPYHDNSEDSGYDTEYNYDDASHPYDSEDDYDDDGNILFNIDRDRDGRFNSEYSEYPYINTHRTKLPFGEIIHSCTEPETIAITFDDGLAGYDTDDDHAGRTIEVLDYLRDNDMVASFFLNGNKRFESNVDVLHRMIDEGHQIGHHTMNHKDLTQLNRDEIFAEMNDLEYLFRDHLGYSPTYMRLPYLASDDESLNVLDELKYHVIGVDVDTKDWEHNSEEGISTSVHNFNMGFNDGRRLVLAHDKHEWALETLLPEMHKAITEGNVRSVTVGECLGDPRENWYRRVHDDDHNDD